MCDALDVGRRGIAPLNVLALVVLLAAPLTSLGADRMVLGEYFTATW